MQVVNTSVQDDHPQTKIEIFHNRCCTIKSKIYNQWGDNKFKVFVGALTLTTLAFCVLYKYRNECVTPDPSDDFNNYSCFKGKWVHSPNPFEPNDLDFVQNDGKKCSGALLLM